MQSELSPEKQREFAAIQTELAAQISLTDCRDFSDLRTAAGVDLAYWNTPDGREHAVCCIVVIDTQTHTVIEKAQADGEITVPYCPGFLAFRELPLVTEAAAKLQTKPELFIFDGNGYLHPRHTGIASHAALLLNAPAFGIAKTYYRVLDTDYTEPEQAAGSYTDIVIGGEVFGRALRTHDGVKPVFVSAGSGISLETATAIAMQLTEKESRIPLPTRLADLETHTARAALRGES